MVILFQQSDEAKLNNIKCPSKGHSDDSGWDLFSPEDIKLYYSERTTVNLQIKFKLLLPWYLKILNLFGIGLEAQIRPKSGRSSAGIDIELGTIDESYTGWVGATVTNFSTNDFVIKQNEKLCQLVFVPVFNRLKLKAGDVTNSKTRGEKGFGSTTLN